MSAVLHVMACALVHFQPRGCFEVYICRLQEIIFNWRLILVQSSILQVTLCPG